MSDLTNQGIKALADHHMHLSIVEILLLTDEDPDHRIGLKIVKEHIISEMKQLEIVDKYARPDYDGDKEKRLRILKAVQEANSILDKALKE